MADQFSRMYDVERVGGDQRQRLAELLRSQGMNQPQGQMVSGWYVPPSWSQNLNSALQMGLGTYMGMKLEDERNQQLADLIRRRKEGVEIPQEQKPVVFNNLEGVEGRTPAAVAQPELSKIQQLAGRQQPSTEQTNFTPAMTQQAPQPKFRPLTESELEENTLKMYQVDPRMASVIASMDATKAAREEARSLKAEQRAWQEKENKLNRENQQLGWAIAAGNRTEPMVSVMDAQGNPVLVPRSQAAGMTPFTPQAQKLLQGQKTASTDVQAALDAAEGLMGHKGKWAGTGWTSWTQNVPASHAKAFGAELNTYKAQSFLSAAQALKGMGALSEKEGDRIIASVGALDASQSEEDFNKGLTTSARTIYNKAKAAGIDVRLPSVFAEKPAANAPAANAPATSGQTSSSW